MRRTLISLLILSAPAVSSAQLGSGTVQFDYTVFSGPMALSRESTWNDSSQWNSFGTVNGITPGASGWVSAGYSYDEPYGYVTGTASLPGGAVADLRYAWDTPGDYKNVISFAPSSFSNVTPGTPFKLGTLTFQNGGWYGGGATAAFNTPTDLGFRITTHSDDERFSQVLSGTIRMVVNAPDPNDTTTLAGQQAEADWVYFIANSGGTVSANMGSFRVYDECCKPVGETNVGTVDVIAQFGSLDLVSFANPQGGFVNGSLTPLPPDPPRPPIPEPATWGMLLVGLAGIGAVRRRRGARTY